MPIDPTTLSIVMARSLSPLLSGLYDYLGTRNSRTQKAPMKIMLTLAQNPRALPDLQKSVNLSFLEFSEVVDALVDANLVEVHGKPGDEVLDLSTATKEALKAYSPAQGV